MRTIKPHWKSWYLISFCIQNWLFNRVSLAELDWLRQQGPWLLLVMFIVFLLLSHMITWVRCGIWLYRLLIFVPVLTFFLRGQYFSHTRSGFLFFTHLTYPYQPVGKIKMNSHTLVSRRFLTSLNCLNNITISHLSVFRIQVSFMFFQYKKRYLVVSKKNNPFLVWGWLRKIRPEVHRLLSLGKHRDVNRWSTGQMFVSHPHTHDGFLYYFFADHFWWRRILREERYGRVFCSATGNTREQSFSKYRTYFQECKRPRPSLPKWPMVAQDNVVAFE